MSFALPVRLWRWRPKAPDRSAPGRSGALRRRAEFRLPALSPLYRPAGLARRWVAYALDMTLSLIFTFGWAAGLLLFLFLLDTLLSLEIWGLLRYGRNAALTAGLFVGLFALPYAGYFVLPLHRAGRTAGLFFAHLRMIPKEEMPPAGVPQGRTFGRLGILRAFVAALPALLAGLLALSVLPDATDQPGSAALLNPLRLPTAGALAFLILTQFADRLLGRELTLGVHERIARVRAVREPRLRDLMERERRVTEAHIAGGMAHEIRNALGTARLQLDRLVEPEVSARAQRALEDILQCLTRSSENGADREGLKQAIAGVRRLYEDKKLFGRALEEVSAAVDRGLHITRRVMDYSRLQPSRPGGREGAGAALVDPNRLLSELAESYREALAGEGIRLELDLRARRPLPVHPAHFYSVFQNLLLNARDAIREKRRGAPPTGGRAGTIQISAGDGDRVWVGVGDDGVGIPAERLERIFDPFFSTKPSQGMGLGLNECRRIMDLYGGEIRVETEVGRGARFTVLWPAAEPGREAAAREAGAEGG